MPALCHAFRANGPRPACSHLTSSLPPLNRHDLVESWRAAPPPDVLRRCRANAPRIVTPAQRPADAAAPPEQTQSIP
jgi:hypothetical protein